MARRRRRFSTGLAWTVANGKPRSPVPMAPRAVLLEIMAKLLSESAVSGQEAGVRVWSVVRCPVTDFTTGDGQRTTGHGRLDGDATQKEANASLEKALSIKPPMPL